MYIVTIFIRYFAYYKCRSFLMDRDTVSNLQFSHFVRDTSYMTEAEKYGWSFVFEPLLLSHKPITVTDEKVEKSSSKSESESSSKSKKSKKKMKSKKIQKPNRIMQGIIDQTDDKNNGMGRVQ